MHFYSAVVCVMAMHMRGLYDLQTWAKWFNIQKSIFVLEAGF